jgi:hypothetical protein
MSRKQLANEERLISIIREGGNGKWPLVSWLFSSGAVIVQTVVPFVLLTETARQELSYRFSYWICFSVSLLLIIGAIFLSFNRNKKSSSLEPIKEFLENICKLFNSAIMSGGEARAIIYIWDKDAKQTKNSVVVVGHFGRLCGTANETGPRLRTINELKCFEAYEQDRAIIANLTDGEKEKSGRTDIKAVFAVPIDNWKGDKVGVLTIDTRKEYEQCYAFFSGRGNNEDRIENIKDALQGIGDNLMKYMLVNSQ